MTITKGQQTREKVVERAAQLFSRKGYFGSSLSDLAQETGLGKSGLYNHFASKDELALAAFDYSVGEVSRRIATALEGKNNAVERLRALITVFQNLIEDPFLEGGCPILNTAVESDDAHPALRDRTRLAVDDWQKLLIKIVRRGIENKELRPDTDPVTFATVFISTLEGGIMLSKLYADSAYIQRAVQHISDYIETLSKF